MTEQSELHLKYAKLYEELEAWFNVACGGSMPEGASKRPDMPLDDWEAFMRGAAYAWAERQDVAIRQVLIWPPDAEIYSDSNLYALCEQAQTLIQHLHNDAYIGGPDILEPTATSLITARLVSVLNQPAPPNVRDALATEALIQEQLTKGVTLYLRNPDDTFTEVPGPTDDDEPPELIGTPVR